MQNQKRKKLSYVRVKTINHERKKKRAQDGWIPVQERKSADELSTEKLVIRIFHRITGK